MTNLSKKLSLRSVLFLCFTLISAIPVLILAGWVQQTALENEYDAVHEKHLIIAQNLTGSISRYITDLKSGFRIAGNAASEWRAPGEVSTFLADLNVDQTWILTEGREPQLYMNLLGADASAPLSSTVTEYFNANRERIDADPSGVYVSGVMLGREGKPVVAAIRELNNGSYLVGLVFTDYITSVQQAISFGKLGHAAIVDQHGKVLAHPLPKWVAAMKDISFIPPVKKMMAGETGVTVFYTPAMQADMIAGHTQVKETGWGVMIPQPVSELEEAAAGYKLISLSIAIGGILFAALVSWWVARFITRPLGDIVSYSETVAAGSLSKYQATQGSFIPRELRKLLVSVENMVDSLLRKTNDLMDTSSKLRQAQKIAKLGNWELDFDSGEMWFSDEVFTILGLDDENRDASACDLTSDKAYDAFVNCFPEEDQAKLVESIKNAAMDCGSFSLEHCLTRESGDNVYVQQDVVVKDGCGGGGCVLSGTLQDISERKKHEQVLTKQAHYDSLTGLPNRNLCVDRITHAIEKAKRNKTTVPLLIIGLDHFNEVNDTMGHLVGDEVLCLASERLSGVLRECDTLARLGSDEFAIVIEDFEASSDISVVTSKILNCFKTAFHADGCDIMVGASIGLSSYPQDHTTAMGLLQKSDTALHAAKASGRGSITAFTAEMDAVVKSRMSLRSDLSTALENDEFHLVFQPIVDSGTGQIVSSEALLRWVHPEKGMISPEIFIPIAEDAGFISEIGLWVLETAIKQLATWHAAGSDWLRVSVNLSLRQVQMGLQPSQIIGILNKHGVSAEKLTLEVTESMLVDDVDTLKQWMMDLKAAGVSFSIDDFGTGYSSLSYLLSLPVSTIKIDRCFVSNILQGSKDETLVSAIIALSQKLGFDVVAEGVEEQAELSKLLEYECEYIQGYFFSKPLSPVDFEERLNARIIEGMKKAS